MPDNQEVPTPVNTEVEQPTAEHTVQPNPTPENPTTHPVEMPQTGAVPVFHPEGSEPLF